MPGLNVWMRWWTASARHSFCHVSTTSWLCVFCKNKVCCGEICNNVICKFFEFSMNLQTICKNTLVNSLIFQCIFNGYFCEFFEQSMNLQLANCKFIEKSMNLQLPNCKFIVKSMNLQWICNGRIAKSLKKQTICTWAIRAFLQNHWDRKSVV